MFQHVVSNFDTKFIMKADDDTFINVPALVHMLHKLSSDNTKFFYIGMRLTRDWCVWPTLMAFFLLCMCVLVSNPVMVITHGHAYAMKRSKRSK